MMTIVYISRHSQPLRKMLGKYEVNEVEQIRNEKNPLSVDGEKFAEEMSNYSELLKIDTLYSSHYVRAMATAKYIANKNNIVMNVEERLGERKFGVNDISELPSNYQEEQFRNWDYKISNGESLNEVSNRMNEVLSEILNDNKNKRIAIISHATAISSMLKKWCEIKLNEESKLIEVYFNGKMIFDGNWKCPELFRLEFDDNNVLMNIENVKYN